MDLVQHTAHRLAPLGNANVVVACSGGRDSMTLLTVLAKLLPPSRLVVAHFDHKIRGTESGDDRAFVEASAKRLGLRCEVGEGPGDRADEASLRTERWRFLEQWEGVVATGHHGGDQLETLLLRLLRGTGPRGLAGIREFDGRRFRPWLAVAPDVIDSWARANGVIWREDASNQSTRYLRNALRHAVVPALVAEAARYGGTPAFFERLAETCRETARWVDASDRDRWEKLSPTLTEFFLRFPSDAFDGQDGTLDVIAVRLGSPLLREQRQRALKFRGARATWGHGLEWHRSCGFDYVTTPAMRGTEQRWRRVAEFDLAHGAKRTPRPLAWNVAAGSDTGNGVWRLPRPGDRHGSRKLKRFWLDARVPEPERALQLVFAEGAQVRWTPLDRRFRLAEAGTFPFAVTHQTH